MRALAHVPVLRARPGDHRPRPARTAVRRRRRPGDVAATRAHGGAAPRLSVLGAYYAALSRHDEARSLAELADVPTRVLVGERDRLTPSRTRGGSASCSRTPSWSCCPALGHMLGFEAPEVITDHLCSLVEAGARERARGRRRRHAASAGSAAAIELRRTGVQDVVLLEKADDLGGVWRDNRYPGCACDVRSHLYSFSFAPSSQWSRTFAQQPEIWDYLRTGRRRLRCGRTDPVRRGAGGRPVRRRASGS